MNVIVAVSLALSELISVLIAILGVWVAAASSRFVIPVDE